MYCFIFGFQRFVWWPKCTPASSKSFNAIPFKVPPLLTTIRALPFAELEALARALLSVLLAFLDPRVAGQEAFLFELRPQFEVVLDQRAGDAEAQRAGLAGDAAAGDRREHVELVGRFGQRERTPDLRAQRLGGEGLLERLVVDGQDPGAGSQENAGRRCLAPAGAVVLDCCCHVLRDLALDLLGRRVDGRGLGPLGRMRVLGA